MASVLVCGFCFIVPQNVSAINWEDQNHVSKIHDVHFEWMGGNQFVKVVHLEMRDGSKMTNVYDSNGNFLGSSSGWL